MAQHNAGFPVNTEWIPIPSSLSHVLEIGSASADTTYDGYNWLRHGQQIAPDAGCQMIHYKCAQANCGVQKSVTSTTDGQILETVYRGSHNHSRRLERSSEDGHTGNHLSGSQGYVLPEVPASSGTLMPRAGQQEHQLSTSSESEEEDDSEARASEDFAGGASARERHVQAPAEQTVGGNIQRNKRRSKSMVWKEFTAVMKDGKIQSAECRHCKKCLSGKTSSGTSHLRRHLRICPARPGKGRVQKQQSSSHPNTYVDKHSKFDQDKSLELLTRAFVSELCSFSLASSHNFRQFIAGICPTYDLASQSAVGHKFLDIFQNEKLKLKEEIALTPGGVLLAVSDWVSGCKHFVSLTVHFIHKEWKMNRKMIKCCFLRDEILKAQNYLSMFPDSKSYIDRMVNGNSTKAVVPIIKEAVQYWSLEQKILGVTFHNSVGDADILGLEENLTGQNYLLAKWKLLTLPCMIDVLRNLISGYDFVWQTCLYWFQYMTCSPQRREKYREIVSQLRVKKPCFGSKQWMFTYHLSEVALQFNKELPNPGHMDSRTYPLKPSCEQLAATENFCSVAWPIYHTIKEISSPRYVTLNSYFDPILKLKMSLLGWSEKADIEKVINVKLMQEKFDKLWKKWYLWLSLAVVLDPRYKFVSLDNRFKEAFGSGAKQYIFEVHGKMYELFTQYLCYVDRRCDEHLNQRNNDLLFNTHGSVAVHDNTSQTYTIEQASQGELGELFRYLQGNLVDLNVPFDILKWWKDNASIYPTLARLARDILVIPGSTVSAESAFDETDARVSLLVNQKMNPEVVEALICTQDWITSSEIGDEEGEKRNVPDFLLTMPPRFSPVRTHTTSGSASSEY